MQYLKRFYSISPYDDWISMDFSSFDKIIRFEHLNEDFRKTLEAIGIEIKRDLPATNTTKKSTLLTQELSPEDGQLLNKVFGVYLEKMGLTLPDEFGRPKVSTGMMVKYRIFHTFKGFYWSFSRRPSSPNQNNEDIL